MLIREGAKGINATRGHYGNLAPIANLGTQTTDSILRVLLKQKRYSLLFEGGHSWIDHRHYFASGGGPPPPPAPPLFNLDTDQRLFIYPVPFGEEAARPPARPGWA